MKFEKHSLQADFSEPLSVSDQHDIDRDFINNTWFILPCNDGEARRSCQILKALKAPMVHVSRQGWGAVLDRELPALDWNQGKNATNVVVFEMPGRAKKGEIPAEKEFAFRGLKLIIVDHHFYRWVDRYKPESSLEQLCGLIGWKLSPTDQAVAVNDRSYIPGLIRLGLSREQIVQVREFDYLAQGLDRDFIQIQQERAPGVIESLKSSKKGDLWIVENISIERNFLLQELSLNERDGLVDLFEISPGKLSFSGRPQVVNHLLGLNYKKFGFRPGYTCYGGGDENFSKFWGFRPGFHTRIKSEFVGTILREIGKFIPLE